MFLTSANHLLTLYRLLKSLSINVTLIRRVTPLLASEQKQKLVQSTFLAGPLLSARSLMRAWGRIRAEHSRSESP